MTTDVIIIGAGAAGLMCAMTAARRGRRVAILERKGRIASKIDISGGGKCNFTNLKVSAENYATSGDLSFVRKALAAYAPADFLSLLKKHGIQYIEKKDGQLFCRKSSRDIVNMFETDCAGLGVKIHAGCDIMSVEKDPSGAFIVGTDSETFSSASLVVATGGLSYPQLCATNFGFKLAERFGLRVTPLRPGLVPLLFNDADKGSFAKLAGISFEARVTAGDRSYLGDILFTHFGLSGPAMLNASLFWNKGAEVNIDILSPDLIPKRFRETMDLLHKDARDWKIFPRDTAGFGKAEVTIGGIRTDELTPKMESKKVKGLYFVGELIDVTGEVGGYNLHWAWTTGNNAGLDC